MTDAARAMYPLQPKNADPGSTEQVCGCFYDSEENTIYLCAGHAGIAEQTAALRAALKDHASWCSTCAALLATPDRAAEEPSESERRFGGHSYTLDGTSDCANGCGCWMGPSRSGGPPGIDPFGPCPKAAVERSRRP